MRNYCSTAYIGLSVICFMKSEIYHLLFSKPFNIDILIRILSMKNSFDDYLQDNLVLCSWQKHTFPSFETERSPRIIDRCPREDRRLHWNAWWENLAVTFIDWGCHRLFVCITFVCITRMAYSLWPGKRAQRRKIMQVRPVFLHAFSNWYLTHFCVS